MMRWIVGASLRLRFLVVAAAAALMYFGITDLRNSSVDVFPEFAPPRVEIQTASLGLSSTEVESLVTVPLEQALAGVPELDVMRSKSVPQLSSILLIFRQGADMLRARQLVQERLATVTPTLPTWASPPFMMQPLSSTSRTMKIGLSSKEHSLIDLSMVSYWTIRQRLMRVPGVANVAIWGERLQMLQVQVEPERLARYGIPLDRVMEVTANTLDSGLLQYSPGAVVGTGGFVETPNQRLGVRHVLPIVAPADLAKVPVDTATGRPMLLGQVTEVKEDHQPLIGDAVINGGPGIMLIVEKFPGANTLEVTRGVEQALDALRPGLPGIEIDSTIFRPATFIETAIHNLSRALLLGCLLVVLVLIAFLFSWRTAVISVVAIPLSLVAAGLVLYWRGTTVNTMVLAGLVIAVGVVVDDAIVDVENIVRRLRQARAEGSTKSTARVVLDASLEVRGAITYATGIIILAVVPVFFLQGLSGAFFRPLALSYALAVLASLLVALTVTPALSLLLLSRARLDPRQPPLVRLLQRGYGAVLTRIVRRPMPTYVVVGVLAALGVAALPGLGQSLLPSFKERDFLMHWVTKPGSSHAESVRIATRAAHELQAIPGVRNFGAHIGQAMQADEVVGVNFGENWISVDPKADYETTVKAVQQVVDGYPGLQRDVQTYLRERMKEVLTGAGESLVVRIYGPDLPTLRTKAEEVRRALADVEGIEDLHVEPQVDVPQVEVKVNLAAAERYGLKPGDVRRAVSTIVVGEEVGDIFRDGKAYDVQVWSTPRTRADLSAISQLLLDTPTGGQVRLKDVATVRVGPAPNVIQREDVSRRIDVGANVGNRDLGSVAKDVQQRLETVNFPREYHAELLGEYAERQAASRQILGFALAAVVLMLVLLYAAFHSWRLAALAFLLLPTALVGGVIAAVAAGGVISLGSLVGFLTVLGIVARNGIMLINHYQHLEHHEGEAFGPELVLRGARERLAPILMTALATALAIVPLVVAGDVPGHEIEHPMAVVILGGLVTSTLLNLFVVPSLYLRFGRHRVPASAPAAA